MSTSSDKFSNIRFFLNITLGIEFGNHTIRRIRSVSHCLFRDLIRNGLFFYTENINMRNLDESECMINAMHEIMTWEYIGYSKAVN